MRTLAAGSFVVLLSVLGAGGSAFAQEAPVPSGELRVVDKNPSNWVWITLNVMDHLTETDKDGRVVPRLATAWRWLNERTLEVKLRRGVTFHNGEVFDAEIVKLNWEENIVLKQPHRGGAYMNFKPGSRIDIVDPYTVRFTFSEPDGAALVKIGWMHIGNREFYKKLGWGEKSW